MEFYILVMLCIAILTLFRVFDGLFLRHGIDKLYVIFCCLCVGVLNIFRFAPFAEFALNPAVFVLPVMFLRGTSGKAFKRFFTLLCMVFACAGIIRAFNLSEIHYFCAVTCGIILALTDRTFSGAVFGATLVPLFSRVSILVLDLLFDGYGAIDLSSTVLFNAQAAGLVSVIVVTVMRDFVRFEIVARIKQRAHKKVEN